MQDLTVTGIFFIPLLLGGIITIYFLIRFRMLRACRIAANRSLLSLRKKDLPLFYASYYIKQDCRRQFFRLPPTAEAKLASLAAADAAAALPKVQEAVRQNPRNQRLLLLCAALHQILNQRQNFQHTIEQIRLPSLPAAFSGFPSALRAEYLYLSALNELYQTDMHTASVHCSQALKLYQKNGFAWEEAGCYMALAQIYRISGVFDVAFTMLREAEKIWTELDISAKKAETAAYLGLTEIGRENFAAADEYLQTAAGICRQNNLKTTASDIKNWQGLSFFLQHRIDDAFEAFKGVTESHAAASPLPPPTQAFAAEMLARISLSRHNYPEALNHAGNALSLHQKSRHAPGIFEALYLQAEIYFASDDCEQSAKILTALIKEKTPHASTFYPANAYTLLGLVRLRQNDFKMARTLFKQAVDLENSHNRLKGAAVDYNNLAELAWREGENEEARRCLCQALSYAEELEDEELKNYLKAKL